MILENQGETTRNKYICKLTECILYDSEKSELSIIEIYEKILERFQLQFDVLEIEKAIELKGKNRILRIGKNYQLTPKASNQISNEYSAEDKLKKFVSDFVRENNIDLEINLLELIEKYLYYSFNSNAKNFLSIIGTDPTLVIDEEIISEFKPTQTEVNAINSFIAWDNIEKNKLFFSIVSSCYEYCLITTNKNPYISKTVFKGKKFFLDTNIIFRMSGFNKDERRFVVNAFVEKCKEVGIVLCYTSTVYDEIFRVINRQIEYIQKLTNGQFPISVDSLSKLSDQYEINDFYVLYCNWCKEPQNNYYDFVSFRKYLSKLVYDELRKLEYVNSPKINFCDTERYTKLSTSLKSYKESKRSYRSTTNDSVETDVNQILFLESLRPNSAKNLWEMNEYLVSADQLFVSWADSMFDGVPLVVIPSLWLSIILKTSGRASNDDYKSFCMFLSLRHHQNNEDEININPVELLLKLSQKTVDSQLKEQIIEELTSNKKEYSFKTDDDYDTSIELAFDKILSVSKEANREELIKAVNREKNIANKELERYKEEMNSKKSEDEFIQNYASKKANKKINWYAQRKFIPTIVNYISVICVVVIVICILFKVQPVVNLLFAIINSEEIDEKAWSILMWLVNIFTITLPSYFGKIWDYLASNERKEKLCDKYFKQQLKVLNDN